MRPVEKQQVYEYCQLNNDFRTKQIMLRYKACVACSVSITRFIGINKNTFIGVNLCIVRNAEREQYQMADVKWNNIMYAWSHHQWALFLAILLKKLKLFRITSMLVTYKIYRYPECNYFEILQSHFKSLISSTPKFASVFKYCPWFNDDGAIHSDSSLLFDTNSCFAKYLFQSTGIEIEDRSKCPAVTYYVQNDEVVLDWNDKIYNSQKEYIQFRLMSAYKQKYGDNRGNTLHRKHQKLMHKHFQFVRKLVEIHKPKGLSWTKDNNIIEYDRIMSQHKEYILPKRVRRLYKKYGLKYNEKYRKKCQVCSKIEIMNDENRNSDKYVVKIYVCKCKRLYVCSRKCQKYAWTQKHHKFHCKARLIK